MKFEDAEEILFESWTFSLRSQFVQRSSEKYLVF